MNESVKNQSVEDYLEHLRRLERSDATVQKYGRILRGLYRFAGNRELDKNVLLDWKQELAETGAVSTVNTSVAAINGYLEWLGMGDCKVKALKVQRDVFRKTELELTRREYARIVTAAREHGHERLCLVLETLASTGIRVSELEFITVEAVKRGRAEVNCKGKRRTVLLPVALVDRLSSYCAEKKIKQGPVFVTCRGVPLDRSNLWKEMKQICKFARVDSRKVYPHNFRHLFAVLYYDSYHDIAKLADLLGHTSITTTRVYVMESGRTHQRRLDRMGLVI